LNLTLADLPSIADAKLPVAYEAAKKALAECQRIDECKKWADKAQAMASYAKQSDDQTLFKYAVRIQARAIRRCGEIYNQIAPGNGARDGKRQAGTDPPLTRKSVAISVGHSERKRKTTQRVANLPLKDFERAIEGDNPPTISKLADQGKKPLINLGNIEPKNFSRATQVLGDIAQLAESASQNDPVEIASGMFKTEIAKALADIKIVRLWLDRFVNSLGD
jgi:hypothetical protein